MRKNLIAFIGFLIVCAVCLVFFIEKALVVFALMAISLAICCAVYENFNLKRFLFFLTSYILVLSLITLSVVAFLNHFISNIYILVSVLLFIFLIALWGWIPDNKIKKFFAYEAKVLNFILTICGIVFIIGQMDMLNKNDKMMMKDRIETEFYRAISYLHSDSNSLVMLGIDMLEDIASVEYKNEERVHTIYRILKDKCKGMQVSTDCIESTDLCEEECSSKLIKDKLHYILTDEKSVFSKFHKQTY